MANNVAATMVASRGTSSNIPNSQTVENAPNEITKMHARRGVAKKNLTTLPPRSDPNTITHHTTTMTLVDLGVFLVALAHALICAMDTMSVATRSREGGMIRSWIRTSVALGCLTATMSWSTGTILLMTDARRLAEEFLMGERHLPIDFEMRVRNGTLEWEDETDRVVLTIPHELLRLARGSSDFLSALPLISQWLPDTIPFIQSVEVGEVLDSGVRKGVVTRVMPSRIFEHFRWRVAWEDGETTIEPAWNPRLIRRDNFLMFSRGDEATSNFTREFGVLAHFTSRFVAVHDGFSHSYGAYWMIYVPQSSGKEDGMMKDAEGDDVVGSRKSRALWLPLSRARESWPLALMSAMFCDQGDDGGDMTRCSRNATIRNLNSWPLEHPLIPSSLKSTLAIAFVFVSYSFISFFAVAPVVSLCLGSCLWGIGCVLRSIDSPRPSFLECLSLGNASWGIAACALFFPRMLTAFCTSAHAPLSCTVGRHVTTKITSRLLFCLCLCLSLHAIRCSSDLKTKWNLRDARRRSRKRRRPVNTTTTEESCPCCRICFSSSDDIDDPLITPCICSGSVRHVHRSCLEEWRKRATNPTSVFACDSCSWPYEMSQTKIGILVRSVPFLATCSLLLGFAAVLSLACALRVVERFILREDDSATFKDFFAPNGDLYGHVMDWCLDLLRVPREGFRWCHRAHILAAGAVFGTFGCFLDEANGAPWIWGGVGGGGRLIGRDEIPPEADPWLRFVWRKLGGAIIFGLLRGYGEIFVSVKISTERFGGGSQFILSLPEPNWFLTEGTLVKISDGWGVVRVRKHRREDDVLELVHPSTGIVIYRSAEVSFSQGDVVLS